MDGSLTGIWLLNFIRSIAYSLLVAVSHVTPSEDSNYSIASMFKDFSMTSRIGAKVVSSGVEY